MSFFEDKYMDFGKYHSHTNHVGYTVSMNANLPSQKILTPKFDVSKFLISEQEEKTSVGLDGFDRVAAEKTEETLPLKAEETKQNLVAKPAEKKDIPFDLDRSNSVANIKKQDIDLDAREHTIKIKGQDVKIKIKEVKENEDGSMEIEEKSDDGKASRTTKMNADGTIIYQEVVYKFLDGSTRMEFYSDEEYFLKKDDKPERRIVKGYYETYTDEEGIQRGMGYSEASNKKNGMLINRSYIDENLTEGYADMKIDSYKGQVVYNPQVGTADVRNYVLGEDRIQHYQDGRRTKEGTLSKVNNDVISVTGINEPFSDDIIPTEAVKNDFFALDKEGKLRPDNVNTHPDNIIKKGGVVTQEMYVNGKFLEKEEHYKESSAPEPDSGGRKDMINSGYTKKNKDGLVTEQYTAYEEETVVPHLGSERFYEYKDYKKVVELIKYDEKSKMHYGKKEVYSCDDGINLELKEVYYIQGTFDKGLRYIKVEHDDMGNLYSVEDTVNFKSGKVYNTEVLQSLIAQN